MNPAPDRSETDRGIDREAVALARYLDGAAPTPYVAGCYRRLLSSAATPEARIDRVLRRAVTMGSVAARIADAYARRFRPTGSLRRRLTLMLAILENAPDSGTRIGAGSAGGIVTVGARVAAALLVSGVALGLGIIVFGPIHAVSGGTEIR